MTITTLKRTAAAKPATIASENVETMDLEIINDLPAQIPLLPRVFKHPLLMHYHRIFFCALMINLAVLLSYLLPLKASVENTVLLSTLSHLVLVNFAVAILIRQQYIINALFWLVTRFSIQWPLSVRRVMGKIYHFGGLHSGCAVMGSLWFVALSVYINQLAVQQNSIISNLTVYSSNALLLLLSGILVFALPALRAKFHNHFEIVHRFGGWAALLLFWTQAFSLLHDLHNGLSINLAMSSWSFWILLAITMSILLPWLRLKKVPVKITRPSSHVALAHFDYGVTPFAGSSTAISRNPLLEWHSFANVPSPDKAGYRLTISRAGDWTAKFIQDASPHVWVKGIPTAGVGNVDQLFKRVIWVATGSGIGPCLPHLLSRLTPSLLVWATRNPRKTYGEQLVDEILAVQPQAIIWDTDACGKPDMLKLAYHAYQQFNAEAVICISNKKLTWQVVYGMESRGIPAYGAIWDS